MTCTVKYIGNWAPTIKWQEQTDQDVKVFSVDVSTSTEHVTSTVVMPMQEGRRTYISSVTFNISGKPLSTTATNIPGDFPIWNVTKSQGMMEWLDIVVAEIRIILNRISHDN